jgi:hypothetical protein
MLVHASETYAQGFQVEVGYRWLQKSTEHFAGFGRAAATHMRLNQLAAEGLLESMDLFPDSWLSQVERGRRRCQTALPRRSTKTAQLSESNVLVSSRFYDKDPLKTEV